MSKPLAYVASPYGFNEGGRIFYKKFLRSIEWAGFDIIDPWATPPADIKKIEQMPFGEEKKVAWARLNNLLGKTNEHNIRRCHILVAGLDGSDVDSGTASEIGFAAALDKMIEGYRDDFRMAGDNLGCTVNLQVEYWIHKQGGMIYPTLDQLVDRIRQRAKLIT